MRKQLRRRPEVEGLEAMTLLSGMTGVAHQVEALAKAPTLPNPLHVTGTLTGTLTKKGHGETIKAAGKLSPIGKVSFSGPATTSVTGGLSSLTIPDGTAKALHEPQPDAGGNVVVGNVHDHRRHQDAGG